MIFSDLGGHLRYSKCIILENIFITRECDVVGLIPSVTSVCLVQTLVYETFT